MISFLEDGVSERPLLTERLKYSEQQVAIGQLEEVIAGKERFRSVFAQQMFAFRLVALSEPYEVELQGAVQHRKRPENVDAFLNININASEYFI